MAVLDRTRLIGKVSKRLLPKGSNLFLFAFSQQFALIKRFLQYACVSVGVPRRDSTFALLGAALRFDCAQNDTAGALGSNAACRMLLAAIGKREKRREARRTASGRATANLAFVEVDREEQRSISDAFRAFI